MHRISADVAGALEVQLGTTDAIKDLVETALRGADGVAVDVAEISQSSQQIMATLRGKPRLALLATKQGMDQACGLIAILLWLKPGRDFCLHWLPTGPRPWWLGLSARVKDTEINILVGILNLDSRRPALKLPMLGRTGR